MPVLLTLRMKTIIPLAVYSVYYLSFIFITWNSAGQYIVSYLHMRTNISSLYNPLVSFSQKSEHCKDTIPKIRNKCFQNRNCAVSVPISTFMCLWAINTYTVYPRSVCLFCCRKIWGPILETYINRAQTHECGNWAQGRDPISFLRIYK